MSKKIILKRTAVPGKVPTTANIDLGELGVNTTDGRVFLNQSGSSVEEFLITNTQNPVTGSLTMSGSLTLIGDNRVTGSLDVNGPFTITKDNTLTFKTTDTGSYVATITSSFPPGVPPEELDQGQWLKADNKLFVSDYWYNVVVYDLNWNYLGTSSGSFTGGAQGLAYNPTLDRVYVGPWDNSNFFGYFDATTYVSTNVSRSGATSFPGLDSGLYFDDANQLLYAFSGQYVNQYDANFVSTTGGSFLCSASLDVNDVGIVGYGLVSGSGNIVLTSKDAVYIFDNSGSLLNKASGYANANGAITNTANGVSIVSVADPGFFVHVADQYVYFTSPAATTPAFNAPIAYNSLTPVTTSLLQNDDFTNQVVYFKNPEYPNGYIYQTNRGTFDFYPRVGVQPEFMITNDANNLLYPTGTYPNIQWNEVGLAYNQNVELTLDVANLTSFNRSQSFQDEHGIIALTSDITSLSSSLAVDVATNISNINTLNSKTLVSSSAQIASNISGSFVASSASLSTRITNLETTSSGVVYTNLSDTSEQTVKGTLRLTGNIVAENYIVSSSVTYMTQSFSSGSTIFGDTADDTHQFTGSLIVSGNITSNIISSSNGGGQLNLRNGGNNTVTLGNNLDFYNLGDGVLFDNTYTALYANNWKEYIELNSGGDVTIYTEEGAINLYPKTGSYILINPVGSGAGGAFLNFDGVSGSNKIFTFPNVTGTIALTSDITTISSSLATRVEAVEVVNTGQSSSIAINTNSITQLQSVTGSYATTGSNQFKASQSVTGSVNVSQGNIGLRDNAYFLQGTDVGGSNVSLIGVTSNDLIEIGNQGYTNKIVDDTQITGSLTVSGSTQPFTVYGSGSDVMRVIGSTGTLFTIDDNTSGNVLEVANGNGYNQLVIETDGDMLTGDAEVLQTLHRTSYLLSSANVSQSITTFVTSSYTTAFFDYTVASGSNARAGSIMSVWNGSNINYTETTTSDIGDTSGVSFAVELSASLATLRSVTTTTNWAIKTTTRAI